jgi:hypothetical protein
MGKRERRRKKGLPQYAGAVLEQAVKALESGALTVGYYEVVVRHDDWCALLAGRGPCDCDPEVGPPQRVPPVG